jgi:very-short-patch-repair endonuclease
MSGPRRAIRRKVGLIATAADDLGGCVSQGPLSDTDRVYLVNVLGVSELLPVRGGRDRRIAAIAAAQRGRVSRRQLLSAGVSASTIQRMVGRAMLHPLHGGVYAVGHLAPVELGAETAALLACSDGAVLSHRTAAALWKLRPPIEGGVHVTVADSQSRRAGIRTYRTRRLDPRDIRTYELLPVTSPARTVLDLASIERAREVERALDEGIVRKILRVVEVEDVLSRASGLRGVPLLAGILERRRGPTVTRSEAEERFLSLIRDALLPPPEINVSIHGYEVDFLWRKQRLVVEVDGYAYHGNRGAFERDRRKDAQLHAAGLSTMRVTWLQMQDEPYALIAHVAQGLVWAEAHAAAA